MQTIHIPNPNPRTSPAGFQVHSAPITKDMVAPVVSLLADQTETYLSKAKLMADGLEDLALAGWLAAQFDFK